MLSHRGGRHALSSLTVGLFTQVTEQVVLLGLGSLGLSWCSLFIRYLLSSIFLLVLFLLMMFSIFSLCLMPLLCLSFYHPWLYVRLHCSAPSAHLTLLFYFSILYLYCCLTFYCVWLLYLPSFHWFCSSMTDGDLCHSWLTCSCINSMYSIMKCCSFTFFRVWWPFWTLFTCFRQLMSVWALSLTCSCWGLAICLSYCF